MFNRKEVKAKGKELFKKYYWTSVLAAIVMGLSGSSGSSGGRSVSNSINQNAGNGASDGVSKAVEAVLSNPAIIIGILSAILIAVLLGCAMSIFLFNPLKVGACKCFLNMQQEDNSSLSALVYAFKNNFMTVALTMFLKDLFIALWSLLFVIPGIIKAYEYRMVPYILADDPTVSRKEAFRRSKEMMQGNKMAAFVYDLSFLGWIWLGVMTCGILIVFYVSPYIQASNAVLYETLKGNNGTTYDATTTYVEY